jgi:HAD superfamily hydrolase (TIGR01509 family)
MLRAIVFDFDGVIANSEPLHFRAFRDELAAHDVALSEREYYATYLGFDDAGAFRAIAADRGVEWSDGQIAAMVASKSRRMEALERDISVLFPGADDAVRRAAAAVPIAIASGALTAEIRRTLERHQLDDLFAAIVGADQTQKSKPAPDPYLHALALLSLSLGCPIHADECVAIEDSHWGLESARSAGLRTVGVAHTYSADALPADLVIRSIGDLDIAILEALCPRPLRV